MVFIESSQVENSMQYVVISVLTKHAEVYLWYHNSEGMQVIKAFRWEIPEALSAKVFEVGKSDDKHSTSIEEE